MPERLAFRQIFANYNKVGVFPKEVWPVGRDVSKAKLSDARDTEARIMSAPASRPDSIPATTPDAIARLWSAVDDHVKLDRAVPERTARLVAAGMRKMAQKLVEEAGEVAVAASVEDRADVIEESADLIYHLTLLWAALGITPEEVWARMASRERIYGLAEKRAKPSPGL